MEKWGGCGASSSPGKPAWTRLKKALDSGADRDCLDLEEHVAPGARRARDRECGRLNGRGLLSSPPARDPVPESLPPQPPRRDSGTGAHAPGARRPRPLSVMLPKGEVPTIDAVDENQLPLPDPPRPPAAAPGGEDPAGIERSRPFGRPSHPRLEDTLPHLGRWGAAAETGSGHGVGRPAVAPAPRWCRPRRGPAFSAPWDAVPEIELEDEAALLEESPRARDHRASRGRTAIHPRQIPAIHQAFTPSPEEVERARRVVAAWEARGGGGVALLDGRLLERPVMLQARRILAASGETNDG